MELKKIVRVVRTMRKLSVFWNFVKPRKVLSRENILNRYFFMGVRFIAINDNYDSADYVGVSVRLMLHLRGFYMISSVRNSLPKYH